MADELVWEYTQKQFLVLDPGTLASSFYLPPLIDVHIRQEYGIDNFIKCLMVADSDEPQVVCLIRNKARAQKNYFENVNYVYDVDMEYLDRGNVVTITRIVYDIPREYRADYHILAAGKYSEISEEAKERIRLLSGVKYRSPGVNGTFIYDKKLLVLDKSPVLKAYIESFLEVTIEEGAELLDRPNVDNYWVVEQQI